MAGPEPKLRELFSKAVQCRTVEEQAAYFEQACQGDSELRSRLEGLLQAHREAGSFLQEPSASRGETVDLLAPAEAPGTMIGPYKLLQQIGEGGMGTVFMAEQSEPVKRKVALKIIKPGMDSRQVIARFEAERQALAMMDHVNIARVFDGGATEAGRPYFVMELVHGVPITKYCDDNHLTPRERLELFVPVCQAIQHAHQKGIIHRDIKPSNVMITLYDGKPVPKVIDFGVAKATEQKLIERTLFTQYGTMVGTLEYMSPEQAEMSALGVDTRSDIYSLGVLLYELLTGSTPLTHKRLKEAAYAEILRMIKEEEPPKPSTRLSDSGEALASISANRHMEPAKLTKLVKGELDWIVMKTLEKDRNRRYETANAFAADVQRYLNDEAVLACPPSAWYRFRKFARRNKAALVTAAAVALVTLMAVGSIGWVIRDRSTRQTKLNYGIEIALQEASLARDRALTLTEDRYQWEAALAAASSAFKRAEELASQDEMAIDPAVRDRLQALRTSLDADERDRRFIARFDELLLGVVVWDARRSPSKGAEAFAQIRDVLLTTYGIGWGQTPPAEVARLIQQRPQPIQENLLAAFDVCLTRELNEDRPAQRWLAAVLATADSDPWRKQARQALAAQDWRALDRLVKQEAAARQRPAFLHLLLSQLPDEFMATKADLHGRIQQAHLGEFWVHNRFAIALAFDNLAWLLANCPDPDSRDVKRALRLSKEAVRLAPNDGDFRNTLGVAYYRVGNWKEAILALQQAVELSKGGDAGDWYFLAMAHWQLGNQEEARGCYNQAVEKNRRVDVDSEIRLLQRFRLEASTLLGIGK